MQKSNFQFSIFNFQFILLLIFTAGCHFTDNHKEWQAQDVFVPDSLWTPTGNAELDSLLQVAATAPKDTSLAKIYNNIGEIYENDDFEMAKEYYLKLKNLSEQLNWNEGRYLYAVSFVNLLNREGLRDSAILILQDAYELALKENDESWKVNIIFSKGNIYFGNEWFETALTCYMEALPIYEKMHDTKKIQQLYYMMAQLYQCINAMDKAIEYGEKSVALDPENAAALCALAMAYSNAHQYDHAKDYFEDALRICECENNLYLMGTIYFHLANNALSLFDLTTAEKYVHQSLEISRLFGPVNCCIDLILLSKLEQMKGNFEKSEGYAKEALQTALEFEALEEQKLCYSILAELALAKGNYSENMKYWEALDLIEMTIAHHTTLRAAEEMNAKYETAKSELEIERQKRIIASHNLQRGLLIGGIALSVLFLSLLWYLLHLRERRNAELAEMNLTKDKFFNIISHDLKNPAIAQRDALKMLIKNASSWDVSTMMEYCCELLKSADEEVELLFNLLSWSQIQTGRMAYMPETFLLSDLLSNLTLIRKMAENKNLTFSVQIPNHALVTGDVNILATVIRNLLTNAVKFTPAGGTVALDISPCMDVAHNTPADNTPTKYTITVMDTGTGMSEKQRRDLFRLDSNHSRLGTAGEQGTGLGLIVCKELVEKHGSKLFVLSEEGKGSRFWFIV